MQPGCLQFAAVWPEAGDGFAKKAVVWSSQGNLAATSDMVNRFVAGVPTMKNCSPPGTDGVETAKLGPFCVFRTSVSGPSAAVVVGTKSWSCATIVSTLINLVQAELTRDSLEFGYWQLQSLAWRAEETLAGGDGNVQHAMPPRLPHGWEWDDEEGEEWEDEGMWSSPTKDSSARSAITSAGGAPAAGIAGEKLINAAPPSPEDFQIEPGAPGRPSAEVAQRGGTLTASANSTSVPFLDTRHTEPPKAHEHFIFPPKKSSDSRFASSTVVDKRNSVAPSVNRGSVTRPASSTQVTSSVQSSLAARFGSEASRNSTPMASVDSIASAVGAESVVSGLPPRAGRSPLSSPGSERASASPAILARRMSTGRLNVADEGSSRGAPVLGTVDASGAVSGGGRDSMAGPGDDHPFDIAVGVGTADEPTVSAAVSEDLAYVYRGSALQSYAITGAIRVAASAGTRARVRVTDRHGHIGHSSLSSTYEEGAADALSKEYICKSEVAPHEAGTFLPTLMYRCSPGVKELPVRAICRLRAAGTAVLVWTQIIANPKLSRPLDGVSLLVHVPFSPSQEEGGFKSDPPASWTASTRMLEWTLPSSIKPGAKQIMQARISVDERDTLVASMPPTAPVMVRCHLLDSTFSSIELEASGLNGKRDIEVTGKVLKRCRVQCRQQA